MTSHGWFLGHCTAMKKLKEIAERVSEMEGVKAVHLVTGPYDIMVHFDFKDKEYADFRNLLKDIQRTGIHDIETWFGLLSFVKGDELE